MTFSNLAIIAGDAELAEHVCSRLRKPGVYLSVIEAPAMWKVEYGFFENACIRVSNAVRALEVQKVLFLKVPPEVANKLRTFFTEIECIAFEHFDAQALSVHARLNDQALGFEALLVSGTGCEAEIFAVEGSFNISHVIAANLAIAHGGGILQLSEVSESELDMLKEELWIWSNGTAEEKRAAKDASLAFVEARLPKALFEIKSDKPISFITRGVPYGLLPFDRPTTHYFPFSSLGINVCSGMLKSLSRARCPVVILIDPNKVGQSEFEVLRKTFGAAGYYLRLAYGDLATVTQARYLAQCLPSDFIFFSTHCGEVDGRRMTERFPDRRGVYHEICYDRILSISPTPEFAANPSPDGLIEVMFLYVPISIDGISWGDRPGKEKVKAGELMEDFLLHARTHKEGSEAREVLANVESRNVKGFEGLQMADGHYLPVHEDIGACHYPVVFNNACCSWRTLAKNFGCSGAAVYIGTATDVFNLVATTVASAFAKAVTSGKCVGLALFRSQKDFTNQFGYTPYLMHGYFYTKLNNPNPQLRHNRVRERCLSAIEAALRLPESERKHSIITFLKQELEGLSNVSTHSI
jgi:hypothetical protein